MSSTVATEQSTDPSKIEFNIGSETHYHVFGPSTEHPIVTSPSSDADSPHSEWVKSMIHSSRQTYCNNSVADMQNGVKDIGVKRGILSETLRRTIAGSDNRPDVEIVLLELERK